jgi:hypothetical protein
MDKVKIDGWLASLDEIGTQIGMLVGELQEATSADSSSEASNTLDTCLDHFIAALDNLSEADKNLRTLTPTGE